MLNSCLTALNHPNAGSVDYYNRKEFASTVMWLEDQKIRQLPIDSRAFLRDTDKLDKWEIEYSKYKKELGMPTFVKPAEEMAWLLSLAVRLEFLDESTIYKDINSEQINQRNKANNANAPNMKSKNIFDNIDFNQPEFERGLKTLVNQLGFTSHPDNAVLLEAAAILINKNKETFAGSKHNTVTGSSLTFEEKYIVAKDRSLDLAVRIMRFNQIYKLRDLQTKINETLVAVQNVTNDPKTDTKLGKVGF